MVMLADAVVVNSTAIVPGFTWTVVRVVLCPPAVTENDAVCEFVLNQFTTGKVSR